MSLHDGDLVEVHGWVMLAKIESGKYRIQHSEICGIPCYDFYRPRGRKRLVRHARTNVDCWLRDENHPDLNKIVRLTPPSEKFPTSLTKNLEV